MINNRLTYYELTLSYLPLSAMASIAIKYVMRDLIVSMQLSLFFDSLLFLFCLFVCFMSLFAELSKRELRQPSHHI